MWKTLTAIIVALAVFDAIYLRCIYSTVSKMIQNVQGTGPTLRIESAVVCYLALTGLLYYFIIREGRSATDAALLGLGTYAVYETTNYAVLKNWGLNIAIIDTLWGGALFYLVTTVVYWLKL